MNTPQVNLVAKVENGAVKVFDANRGAYLRTLTNDGVSVQVSGHLVTVVMKNGKLNVYDGLKGSYLRSL